MPPEAGAARYTTRRADRRGGRGRVPGLPLTFSFTNGSDGPRTEVWLGTEEITEWSAFHDDSGDLVLGFDLHQVAAIVCGNEGFYLQGEARFDRTMQTFTGTLSALCDDRKGTLPYLWVGETTKEERDIVQRWAFVFAPATEGFST